MEEIEDIIASAEAEAGNLSDDEEPGEETWTIDDETCVVKRTDRHVFLYRETVIPEKVRGFFLPEGLEPGKKSKIILWLGNRRFDAFVERTLHAPPLIRLRWFPDFAGLLQKTYPEWHEYFKKCREATDDPPVLFFTRRPGLTEFDVAFDRALSKEALAADEIPLKKGDVIPNERIRDLFKCSSQGSMRRSLETGSIVIVSDHTRPGCNDKWIGKIFHFTGMGHTGEPGLSFNQNKDLCEADEKGRGIYLFEVFQEGAYTYAGEVVFADNPYLSRQSDITKTTRDVTVFPLKTRNSPDPHALKPERPDTKGETPKKNAQKNPHADLTIQAGFSPEARCRNENISGDFNGDDVVAQHARQRAGGICQLCSMPAPFKDNEGEPYLETHHIVPLEEGGQDSIENIVALCPNCHRKMHVLNLPADVVRLRNRVIRRD